MDAIHHIGWVLEDRGLVEVAQEPIKAIVYRGTVSC